MIKAVCAVVFLVPGLFLAIFKVFAYLFSDVQEQHRLLREHLTPIDREIGSVANPIETPEALQQALNTEFANDGERITHALIIRGKNLRINTEPGILRFNPLKLILNGATVVHAPSAVPRLDDEMSRTGKWEGIAGLRVVDVGSVTAAGPQTVAAALADTPPRREFVGCKRFHKIYYVTA
jgi:hypothetical protein